jgi:hypothetical protein
MQDMMSSMMRNNGNTSTGNNNGNGNRNNGNRNNGNRNNGNNNGYRNGTNQHNNSRPTKYCWSHGACTRDSPACRTKSSGHQDAATFSNMMGGSTHGCFWL